MHREPPNTIDARAVSVSFGAFGCPSVFKLSKPSGAGSLLSHTSL